MLNYISLQLIQFLVTIVQPSTRMGGLGVKRQYPLMINECPKRARTSSETATSSDGPVIHELDETTSPYEPLLIECEQEQEVILFIKYSFMFMPESINMSNACYLKSENFINRVKCLYIGAN